MRGEPQCLRNFFALWAPSNIAPYLDPAIHKLWLCRRKPASKKNRIQPAVPNTQVDLKDFYDNHTEWLSERLMSFFAVNHVMCATIAGVTSCPSDSECGELGSSNTSCVCSADLEGINDASDLEDMTDAWVYDQIETCLSTLMDYSYQGKKYITNTSDDTYTYKFLNDDGDQLTHKQNVMLYRTMLKNAAFLGSYGTFNSGSGPVDPLFWVSPRVYHGLCCSRYAGDPSNSRPSRSCTRSLIARRMW